MHSIIDDYERQVEEAESKLARVTQERDETRRAICRMESRSQVLGESPEGVAERRGWDCFKTAGTQGV